MTILAFSDKAQKIGAIRTVNQDISTEPMLYKSDKTYAYNNGGPITKSIISMLPEGDYSIDTKSVFMQVGQYPSIPGWHLDSCGRKDGKVDLSQTYKHDSYLCVLGPDFTEFFINTMKSFWPDSKSGKNIWSQLNTYIEQLPEKDKKIKTFEEGSVVRFSGRTVHRCPAITKRGWRYFFRATHNGAVENQIRNQTPIYIDMNNPGW